MLRKYFCLFKECSQQSPMPWAPTTAWASTTSSRPNRTLVTITSTDHTADNRRSIISISWYFDNATMPEEEKSI